MSDEETKNNQNTEVENESLEAARDDSGESDDVVEFEFNDDGEEDLRKTLKKLRMDLKQAKKEKEEYLTGWQKERADFVNYKKEESARLTNFSTVFKEQMLSRFLSVMDSFGMAFANKEAWEKVDVNWRKGVEYIYSQLGGIFEEYGVKEIGKVGEPFDPNIHESLHTIPTDKKDLDHTVSEVIQKGYKLGDPRQGGASRVMRPAKVNVYEFRDANN